MFFSVFCVFFFILFFFFTENHIFDAFLKLLDIKLSTANHYLMVDTLSKGNLCDSIYFLLDLSLPYLDHVS